MTLLHSNYVKFFLYLLYDYFYSYCYYQVHNFFLIVLRVSCKHKGPSLLKSSLCMKNNIFLHYSKNIKIKKLTLTKCYYLIYKPYSNFSSCPNKIIFTAKERKNSGSRF